MLAELDPIEAVSLASASKLSDLQVAAIKIARQKLNNRLLEYLKPLASNADPQVQREMAIALRFQQTPESAKLWAQLAIQYKGDRWFLEALGIGSDLNADACFKAWQEQVGDQWKEGHNKDIVWRIRSESALPLLAELIEDQKNIKDTHKYFRSLDFHQAHAKNVLIERLINRVSENREEYLKLAFTHMDKEYVLASSKLTPLLVEVVESYRGSEDFLAMIEKYQLRQYNQELLQMVLQQDKSDVNAARLLLKNEPVLITDVLGGNDEQHIGSTISALGAINNDQSLDLLHDFMMDESNALALRQHAARHFATGWTGENRSLELLDEGLIPEELITPMASSLSNAWRPAIRTVAAKYLENESPQHGELPSIAELTTLNGNAISGAAIYEKLCSLLPCGKIIQG